MLTPALTLLAVLALATAGGAVLVARLALGYLGTIRRDADAREHRLAADAADAAEHAREREARYADRITALEGMLDELRGRALDVAPPPRPPAPRTPPLPGDVQTFLAGFDDPEVRSEMTALARMRETEGFEWDRIREELGMETGMGVDLAQPFALTDG